MLIRPGRAGDAEAIGAMHTRAWWHGYEDVLSYDQLTAEDAGDRGRAWAELLGGAGSQVLVATAGEDDVCAAVSFGPARDEDRPGEGEIYALYVDPPAQGAGVGRRLLDAALAGLRTRGYATAGAWVFAANGHGLAFYAAAGFAPDGTERVDDEGATSVRVRRSL